MATVLDHTIIPSIDQDEAAEWYARVMNFQNLGRMGPFAASRINENTVLLFRTAQNIHSVHIAFGMTPREFDGAFQRIRDASIPFGDSPAAMDNMQGPGTTLGAKGPGKAVYFKDPSGHDLEIKSY